MITEHAQIVEIGSDRLKIAIRSGGGCSSCTAKAGCGNGILDQWLNPTQTLWIDSEPEHCRSVSVGDQLKIGVEEGAFVRNALSLYLIPILVFLAGAGLGYQLFGELASVLGGVLGLILGAEAVKYLLKRSAYASDFSPHIVR